VGLMLYSQIQCWGHRDVILSGVSNEIMLPIKRSCSKYWGLDSVHIAKDFRNTMQEGYY
jgi:hypothetical protein